MSKLELVEHHDDVRRLARRLAGLIRRRQVQALEDWSVDVQQAARDIFADRGHPRARELGNVVPRREIVASDSWANSREPGEPGKARRKSRAAAHIRTRKGSNHQIAASERAAPGRQAMVTVRARSGKIASRKANVSVSMIMRSTKLTVMNRTTASDATAGSGRRAWRATRRRPPPGAAAPDPEEIEDAPGENERGCETRPRSVRAGSRAPRDAAYHRRNPHGARDGRGIASRRADPGSEGGGTTLAAPGHGDGVPPGEIGCRQTVIDGHGKGAI